MILCSEDSLLKKKLCHMMILYNIVCSFMPMQNIKFIELKIIERGSFHLGK